MRRKLLITGLLAVLVAIAGCTTANDNTSQRPTTPTISATTPAPSSSSASGEAEQDNVEGTLVRFASGDSVVDITITADNPTTRDFLSRLPLTLSLEEFAGREKVSYLSPKLETAGSPGSDPENGDLIYFVPWGNLGFYYSTDGIGYSDQTIALGTYDASLEQLSQLEGTDVIAEVIE